MLSEAGMAAHWRLEVLTEKRVSLVGLPGPLHAHFADPHSVNAGEPQIARCHVLRNLPLLCKKCA
jgi:hypothetical protein